MAKTTTSYCCSECGWASPVWVGRCRQCEAWGSLDEARPQAAGGRATAPTSAASPISAVAPDEAKAVPTGIGELDRVLGAGLVPGAVVLLAGEPGVGKSTLLLEAASAWARAGRRTLYVSAEESAAQVRRRADRISALADELYLAAENDLGAVLGHIEELSPTLLVLDSVQTVTAGDGTPGSVSQVREVTNALVRVAKRRAMAVLIIGHVTKDGGVAGPRTLEHLVDVVLSFEGDRQSGFRMVRAAKNRFGPADEVGCFEMTETGIAEVSDPSGLFTSSEDAGASGVAVTVALEGRRPLLAEVQALVTPTAAPSPRRVTHGLDASRVAIALAVLQRRARVKTQHADVYVSTVGGVRLDDPATDLAVVVAVASAVGDWHPSQRFVALGEVGLSGELRRSHGIPRRLAEAERLGVRAAVVPAGCVPGGHTGRLRILEARTVAEALDHIWLELTDHRQTMNLRAWQKTVRDDEGADQLG